MTINVAGGGIAGLTFALTCHELGQEVRVFEAARDIRPLGVGINLQPNAVRELFQLGLEKMLRTIGVEAQEWALFFLGAHPVWSEPRGTEAGYRWPQFSVHRGQLQMRLLDAVRDRLGNDALVTDARLMGFENRGNSIVAQFKNTKGELLHAESDLLVGADGIHSNVRKQIHPTQGNVNWNGAIMWRGVSRCKPPRTKNSFVMIGSLDQRFICYPTEPLDENGETMLNWIAETRTRDGRSVDQSDWNKAAEARDFMSEFSDWIYDWISVPQIVDKSEGIWEFPMVDRDPVSRWVEDRAVLIGDAAHAMFPHGSSGASQAIVDGRVLGAAIKDHGPNPAAAKAYESKLLQSVNDLVLRNRGEGPIGVLIDIEKRLAAGISLSDAIVPDEVASFMARYKQAAGLARDSLNAAPPIIGVNN